jgi:hypothetical protein
VRRVVAQFKEEYVGQNVSCFDIEMGPGRELYLVNKVAVPSGVFPDELP